eukprot:scaffold13528_cov169-Amphora_coffeaeformis.AAC.11
MGPPTVIGRLTAGRDGRAVDMSVGTVKLGVGRHSHKRASSPAVIKADMVGCKGVQARTTPR